MAHTIDPITSIGKPALYDTLSGQLNALLEGERDWICNLANTSALLKQQIPGLNWAGFYLCRGSELVLGPFQGKTACMRIPSGKGVCGTAAAQRRTLIVPDVSQFPGHIACDIDSRSEIVVPLVHRDRLIGVLDLDSPNPGRFDTQDAAGLEKLVAILLRNSDL
jgi:L-methionine (R)-S-oxide reductase